MVTKISEDIVCITRSAVSKQGSIARKMMVLLRPNLKPVHNGIAIVVVKILKSFHSDW